jgi:iron complex transport system substrate-binding protein
LLVLIWQVIGCGGGDETSRLATSRSAPAATRIVSLSLPASDLLIELGAAESIIATDARSQQLAAIAGRPVVSLGDVELLRPDLVLVPPFTSEDAPIASRLLVRGIPVIAVAFHDFDEAFAMCRVIGARIGREGEANALVRRIGRALARLTAASAGRTRPRVAAVLRLDPLEIAGGHSFVTDLIEVAGGESLTHGSHEARIPASAEELAAKAPDRVLVIRAEAPSEEERRLAREVLDGLPPPTFVVFDPERAWLHDAERIALQLRALGG